MKTVADLLHEQVVKLIEPLTRFDRTSLNRGAEQTRVVKGEASWWYFAELQVVHEDEAGELPVGTYLYEQPHLAKQAAEKALESAKAAVSERIMAWTKQHVRSDAGPPSGVCYDGPKEYGSEAKCSACGGKRQVSCDGCGASGRVRCSTCSGRGRASCRGCGGRGTTGCGQCGASGRRSVYRTEAYYDNFTKQWSTRGVHDWENCNSCGGRGNFTCSDCGGGGSVSCWTCNASGNVTCRTCGGSGEVDCKRCEATGWRHQLWRVFCHVRDMFEVNVEDPNPEVKQRLETLIHGALEEVAVVNQIQPYVNSHSLRRRYEVACHVCELDIEASAQTVHLVSYGGSAKVYNFKNVVEALLEGDLAELEQAVKDSSAISFAPQPALVEAARQCLFSEANAMLGQGGEALRRVQSLGGLSESYAARLTKALQTALRRLYFGEMALGATIAAVLPAIVYMAAAAIGWSTTYGAAVLAGAPTLGAAAFAVMEHIARRRLGAAFGEIFGKEKIDAMLVGQNVIKRWRVGTAAVATVLFIAAVANL